MTTCTFIACDGIGCNDDDLYSGHSPLALKRLEETYKDRQTAESDADDAYIRGEMGGDY
jgi:hypothetical protein